MKFVRFVSLCLSSVLAFAPASAADIPIKVSYQPSLYWALPFYVASEKNFWAAAGLKPEFATFPAGAPQVAAAQAKSWDVGGTGSVPAVLGAARFGLVTIGITNDESKANVLMVRADKFEATKKNPSTLKGKRILLTANSTGDYAVQNCLKKYGLVKADVQLVNLAQAQIISAVTSNNGDFAGVWAPNTYTLEEKAGAKALCSGADAGAIVPGALIVRPEYAKENPEAVAKFLAVYLRAWSWIKAHPKDSRDLMRKFYALGGVEVSDKAMDAEFATRPVFGLDEQVKLMDRARGASTVDGWFGKIADFMTASGTITQSPDAKTYIDATYMKKVAMDPALAKMANSKD